MADNLGWGELGCYGGGSLRGAPTPRIDTLADEGLRLSNYNVESDCVPTRAALMTGRQAIDRRFSIPASGCPAGTDSLGSAAARTYEESRICNSPFGKWHLGEIQTRLPNARGFDEWYGLPRTLNEAFFTSAVGYDPEVVPKTISDGRESR